MLSNENETDEQVEQVEQVAATAMTLQCASHVTFGPRLHELTRASPSRRRTDYVHREKNADYA